MYTTMEILPVIYEESEYSDDDSRAYEMDNLSSVVSKQSSESTKSTDSETKSTTFKDTLFTKIKRFFLHIFGLE